jgi:DNA gyrase subunit A
VQGRGGLGVVTARIVDARGELIGALMVHPDDEVFAITSAGGVIRTAASEIKISGRQTMGVRLVNLGEGQSLVAIARNAEATGNGVTVEIDVDDVVEPTGADPDNGSDVAGDDAE